MIEVLTLASLPTAVPVPLAAHVGQLCCVEAPCVEHLRAVNCVAYVNLSAVTQWLLALFTVLLTQLALAVLAEPGGWHLALDTSALLVVELVTHTTLEASNSHLATLHTLLL